ncbi:hypothetical protein [Dokdonia sp.]|uniref:hypothetical protein n=1 Tax=Dokdonia sp. TaxID=2024995 RepID=UPI003266098C
MKTRKSKTRNIIRQNNLQKLSARLLFILSLILFFSCSEKETVVDGELSQSKIIQNDVSKSTIEGIISEMKNLGDSQEKIIVFETKNIISDNPSEHFKILNVSKKAYIFSTGSSKAFLGPDDNYTVTCSYSDGETVVTECGNDVACAGSATWECTENGGCATICNAKITYIPASYKIKQKKLENLDKVLQEVEEISKSKNNESLDVTLAYDGIGFTLKNTSRINASIENKNSTRAWQVDCFDSDGDLIWSETFEDRLDASQAILNCTDVDGGCANVCEIVGIKYLNSGKK